MTFLQELASWRTPEAKATKPVPVIGSKAHSSERLLVPDVDGRPIIVTFLRHCGCPFAEKTFIALRTIAAETPSIRFVAVSHSDQASTERWLEAVGGAGDSVQVIVDAKRNLFAQWGLGVSSLWHVLNPAGLWEVYQLGRDEGIWNRPTESGSRWQTAGSFAVDAEGIVRWGGACSRASEIPDFHEAVEALKRAEHAANL
ncbi:Alkyl hydroperoxide reductase subunit C [Penicillium taxi]|uniref:Alkyl hydroperoxide reductase subunit C n=1 Tax=Penicillium taxi TaxID=168475 RepID=UPI0025457FFC|nr:Alkyl hydroperoxide reductase subunit C [Penicillium taxi]KAJ5888017.1 Alkyl hydroperoxide reductase subunit C [Penicillium taxi]